MGKLLHYKEWLTVADAAKHLSIVFGEDVAEADVLRFALDGHLKLSVHFVNGAYVRHGKVVPMSQAFPEEEELIRLIERIKDGGYGFTGFPLSEHEALDLSDGKYEYIDGIWGLSMYGAEREHVEHAFQLLTGGVDVTIQGYEVIVVGKNGEVCQLLEPPKSSEEWELDKYEPALCLPEDSNFVVRTDALREFEQSINGSSMSTDEPTPGRRKHQIDTILVVVAALQHDPLKIPDGGKSKIKAACLTRPAVFTDSSFDHAWKQAVSDGLVRMENHDKFIK